MRILLAIDGSTSADVATSLVAALPWHDGGRVRIVTVAPILAELGSEVLRSHQIALDAAEREIRSAHADIAVESVLVRGRPATVILDEAREVEADLVVLGHRGQSPWDATLLGSVAVEVVEHAPCAVLVARVERLGPVILANDGSPHARSAECLVREWPIFGGLPVTVLTVTDKAFPYASAVAPMLYTETMTGYAEPVGEARRTTRDESEAAASRLNTAGFGANAEVREGDPATQIIARAIEGEAGLIIVGTRGQTRRRRLILGSVARKVLLHADCSVLVVHAGPRLDGGRITLQREERELVSAFG